MNYQSITPAECARRLSAGEAATLIDVRAPVVFREMHAAPATNVPFEKLNVEQLKLEVPQDGQQTLFVICEGGKRSVQACQKLSEAGLENVVNVEGGSRAWEAAGLEVVRDPTAFSLERQVRVAAGALVLTGTLAGVFAHPYFLAIPAFVGAGLVFAGVTDWCGMGLLLSRMPWNQNGGSCNGNQCGVPK